MDQPVAYILSFTSVSFILNLTMFITNKSIRSYTAYPHSMLRTHRGSSGLAEAIPITARQSARIKIESPSVLAAAKKATIELAEDTSTDVESSTRSSGPDIANASISTHTLTSELAVESPTKSKL